MERWVLVDFDSCPECGDDAEILTASGDSNRFYDGDKVRCCECHHSGQFSCDSETPGYIVWNETDQEYEKYLAEECPTFMGEPVIKK